MKPGSKKTLESDSIGTTEQKRKILISCDDPRSLLDFRGRLIEALLPGQEVSVFTPRITQPTIRRRLDELGVRVYENNLQASNVSVWSDLRYMMQLRILIRALRPDVFFPYTFKPVIYGLLVARYCRVPLMTPMLTGLGNNFINAAGRRTMVQRITHILLKISLQARGRQTIIFQNHDDRGTLYNAGILSHDHKSVVVNGSGVDLSHYYYLKPDRHRPTFVMISRLINTKGVKEYFKAASLLKARYPKAIFQLIGPYDDNVDAISPALFEEIKSGTVLDYMGRVNDIRPYICSASVVVLPSYYGEGVPRSLLEAMAMGRAIITCDSVGCRDTVSTISDTVNGFLVPPANVAALSATMEHCLLHPEELIGMGLNGRRYAEEKFDVHKVNKQMLKILSGDSSSPQSYVTPSLIL
ncbi:glycosyl transferase [Pedobacter sp. BAL39]|uniref:glycosyltransferase family 4 protein n=1 Tax=Pedobacter sp. BAL39 TaxID=391596 RepID=UPI0001559B92|nr:glycosyltransferase family 4 protein [Pedobacter sp. BAL39]EDM38343.1 glycosyl transferase [Pedobacter sp. BAL39]